MRLGTCIALELVCAAGAAAGVWFGVGWSVDAAGEYIGSHEASAASRTSPASIAPPVIPLPGAQLRVAAPAPAPTVFEAPDDILLAPVAATPVTGVKLNHGGTSLSLRLEFASGARAAFKPQQTHPQSDPKREIAAYRIDRLLGIGHVPPAKPGKFRIDDLVAATEPAVRAYTAGRFDDEAITHGGIVLGELSWWIPEIRDVTIGPYRVDEPDGMALWQAYLRAGAVIPPEQKSLVEQLATCVVFDVLIDNADRWSGNNTKGSIDRSWLYFMDNTLAFSIFTLGHETNLTPLHRISVFSRGLVERMRHLTFESVTAALGQRRRSARAAAQPDRDPRGARASRSPDQLHRWACRRARREPGPRTPMTTCPVCGKPVDPIRAPAVGVRDGKVVSYCSKEHAAEAESKPVAVPKLDSKAEQERTERIGRRTPIAGVPIVKKARTPATGVAQVLAASDSGPVIEIVHEPASGVVTSAADARSGKASSSSRAQTEGSIQIADTGHLDDYVDQPEPGRHRGLWSGLAIVVILGGGAFVAYQLGYFGELVHRDAHPVAPGKAVESPPVPVAVPVDAAPQVSPADAVDRAREVLRAALHSDSPRVQRVAASALARTGDPEALAQLAGALAKETSDIAKLDILYALGRGGDKRGSDGLVAALAAPRRDVRAEAGRRLALLGDKRAIDTLAQYLDVSQLRLGAAEQLAYLAEPRAVKALDQVRTDPKSSPDDQARAAIALGLAGRTDVAPALRALLGDARFNAFAAASLASLHDLAARPVLVKQLEVPSLRVAAARSLRRLEPELDATPLLPPLLAALGSGKDTEQVQAAEAMLLLGGPRPGPIMNDALT